MIAAATYFMMAVLMYLMIKCAVLVYINETMFQMIKGIIGA